MSWWSHCLETPGSVWVQIHWCSDSISELTGYESVTTLHHVETEECKPQHRGWNNSSLTPTQCRDYDSGLRGNRHPKIPSSPKIWVSGELSQSEYCGLVVKEVASKNVATLSPWMQKLPLLRPLTCEQCIDTVIVLEQTYRCPERFSLFFFWCSF